MNTPIFLSLDDVLQIHQYQLEEYGGSDGIRDIGLIESAIAQPQQQFGGAYVHSDIATMSAAYLFHLCSNHGFVDGNKRAGVQAALVFLYMNGVDHECDADDLADLAEGVASGTVEKGDAIEYFQKQLKDC